jgi:hypothetical protein
MTNDKMLKGASPMKYNQGTTAGNKRKNIPLLAAAFFVYYWLIIMYK